MTIPISAFNPNNKQVQTFITVESLAQAIEQGWVPIRDERFGTAAGSLARVQHFMGGALIDGMTTQVLMGEGWLQGQIDAVSPLWQSGAVPTPPSWALQQEIKPMPSGVAAQTEAWIKKQSQGSLSLGLILALGIAAVWYLRD